jgi:hypothetical protein
LPGANGSRIQLLDGEKTPSNAANALEPLDRTRHLGYSSAALTHGQSLGNAEGAKWFLHLDL